MNIYALERKMRALDITKVAGESITDTIEDLQSTNKKQLFAGYNKDGERLKSYRSSDYAFYKANRNPIPGLGNPDLFDTGSFYAGFRFSVTGQQIIEESTDAKNNTLQRKYGRVFGLGGTYKERYIKDSLRPAFTGNMRKVIGI